MNDESAMRREDSGGALMVGRGKIASEGYPHVGIETRMPHKDKVLTTCRYATLQPQLCCLSLTRESRKETQTIHRSLHQYKEIPGRLKTALG